MILAPSNDWRAIDPLHTNMACLRGIELGCAVIRHTSIGLSQAADCQGHVLARMDHFTTPANERVMVAHVPVQGTPTFYARFGDLFSWGCVLGLAPLACIGVTRRSQDPQWSNPRTTGRTAETNRRANFAKMVRILPRISGRLDRARRPRPDSAKTYGNLASQKRPENRMSFWLG
jgi:hypothetical protein